MVNSDEVIECILVIEWGATGSKTTRHNVGMLKNSSDETARRTKSVFGMSIDVGEEEEEGEMM